MAVAEKERERAEAQAQVLTAEAEREKAKQQVVTVTVTSEAEREAQKKLIAAQNEVKQNKIREQTEADVLAYTQSRKPTPRSRPPKRSTRRSCRLAEGDSVATPSAPRANGPSRWST